MSIIRWDQSSVERSDSFLDHIMICRWFSTTFSWRLFILIWKRRYPHFCRCQTDGTVHVFERISFDERVRGSRVNVRKTPRCKMWNLPQATVLEAESDLDDRRHNSEATRRDYSQLCFKPCLLLTFRVNVKKNWTELCLAAMKMKPTRCCKNICQGRLCLDFSLLHESVITFGELYIWLYMQSETLLTGIWLCEHNVNITEANLRNRFFETVHMFVLMLIIDCTVATEQVFSLFFAF